MLARAAQRIGGRRIELLECDVCSMRFSDDAFDGAIMGFGIRNVPDRPSALRQIARVVKPGGRVVILEASEPHRGFLAPFARFYLHKVVPGLGALLSRGEAYRYLSRSIADFPDPETFARTMEDAGLEIQTIRPSMLGAIVLFIARVRGRDR
jgi:demethylmenaquinone methyltransferase/2-methoxy-6-polyprenyl-1,4-benzoquinol methylase